MRPLYLLSVWLHILSAAVWIGGMVFFVVVLVPVIRQPENQRIAAPLVQRTGGRFRLIGWLCLVLLLATGILNLFYRGFDWNEFLAGRLWEDRFGVVVALKLLFFGTILLLSVWHDFFVGPRATAIWRADPTAPETKRLRAQASWIGRINLLLALAMVALGIILVRGRPW